MKFESGFTLLELIISVTILVLFLGVIFGTIRLASRSWEAGEKRVERIQRARVSYDLISEDIKSIFPFQGMVCPGGNGCRERAHLFIGEGTRIKFVTSNPGLRLSQNKYRIVSYYLDDTNNAIIMEEQQWLFPDFFRIEDEDLCFECSRDDEFKSTVYRHSLYPYIEELRFEYYGTKQGDSDPEWYESWNSLETLCACDRTEIESKLPQKVKVIIRLSEIDDKDIEKEDIETVFVVPIIGGAG